VKKTDYNFKKTNQFGFMSLKLKKPNQTQTGKNRAKPKNRAKQFEPFFVQKTELNQSV
jgi:hypothetical protein